MSEENAVGVRNDTFTRAATSSQLLNKKFKSINLNPSATLLSNFQNNFVILQGIHFVFLSHL